MEWTKLQQYLSSKPEVIDQPETKDMLLHMLERLDQSTQKNMELAAKRIHSGYKSSNPDIQAVHDDKLFQYSRSGIKQSREEVGSQDKMYQNKGPSHPLDNATQDEIEKKYLEMGGKI
jgi:hypothetical protein